MSLLRNIAARRSVVSKLEKEESLRVDNNEEGVPNGPAATSGLESTGSQEGQGPVRQPSRTIHERSPVGSSQSNGFIERGIQDEEGHIRTVKLDFESRIGSKIPSTHDLIPWLIEYAAVLINRGQVGADGKTAYERLKGKKAVLPGLQFGERVLWKSNVPS